jgi:hypothetical protein
MIGDSDEIEKVMALDPQTGSYVTLKPGETDNESFPLSGNEGLIVYAKTEKQIIFDAIAEAPLNLEVGANLICLDPFSSPYTAYQLLSDFSSEGVVSIQRYSPESGAFETASVGEGGVPVGVDFPIVVGEGYLVTKNQ